MKTITKDHVKDFMKSVGIMSVAVNDTPYPISSVLLFALDDQMNIYFATHANTHKAQALSREPRISFSVWEQHHLLVQGSGNVHKITDEQEVSEALDLLANSAISIEDFWPPVLQLEPDIYAVFKITPTQMQAIPLEYDTMSSEEMKIYPIEL